MLYRRMNRTRTNPCTKCRYCMPYMAGIEIPECLAAFNDAAVFSDITGARFSYDAFTGFGDDASQCQDCGVSESLCPQHLPIRKHLKEVSALFGH